MLAGYEAAKQRRSTPAVSPGLRKPHTQKPKVVSYVLDVLSF